jgi:hypothetical protein
MYLSHDVATQNLDLEFAKTIPSNANGTVMAQQLTLKFCVRLRHQLQLCRHPSVLLP